MSLPRAHFRHNPLNYSAFVPLRDTYPSIHEVTRGQGEAIREMSPLLISGSRFICCSRNQVLVGRLRSRDNGNSLSVDCLSCLESMAIFPLNFAPSSRLIAGAFISP